MLKVEVVKTYPFFVKNSYDTFFFFFLVNGLTTEPHALVQWERGKCKLLIASVFRGGKIIVP